MRNDVRNLAQTRFTPHFATFCHVSMGMVQAAETCSRLAGLEGRAVRVRKEAGLRAEGLTEGLLEGGRL
jgi:hypothetical protein